jgi:hypothetical protein
MGCICDLCDTQYGPSHIWRCDACDYDLCDACVIDGPPKNNKKREVIRSPAGSKNSASSSASSSSASGSSSNGGGDMSKKRDRPAKKTYDSSTRAKKRGKYKKRNTSKDVRTNLTLPTFTGKILYMMYCMLIC